MSSLKTSLIIKFMHAMLLPETLQVHRAVDKAALLNSRNKPYVHQDITSLFLDPPPPATKNQGQCNIQLNFQALQFNLYNRLLKF